MLCYVIKYIHAEICTDTACYRFIQKTAVFAACPRSPKPTTAETTTPENKNTTTESFPDTTMHGSHFGKPQPNKQ